MVENNCTPLLKHEMYQIFDERRDFGDESAFLFDKSIKVFGGNKKSSYIC